MKRLANILLLPFFIGALLISMLVKVDVAAALAPNCGGWSVVSSPGQGIVSYFRAVTAKSTNDVWAAGSFAGSNGVFQTLVEHWNGTSWNVVSSPNPGPMYNEFYGVAAVSTNDVWAVGIQQNSNGTFQTLTEHWDGTSWSVIPSPNVGSSDNTLTGVAAISGNDVWAIGYYASTQGNQTLTEHWNGTSWNVVSSPPIASKANVLNGVAAVSTNDVWAVGDIKISSKLYQTLVEHWDGTKWSAVSSPNAGSKSNYLFAVAAISSNDVWSVGVISPGSQKTEALIEHWNGTSWSIISSPPIGQYNHLLGVAAVSTNDIWSVGDNNGQTLTEHYC